MTSPGAKSGCGTGGAAARRYAARLRRTRSATGSLPARAGQPKPQTSATPRPTPEGGGGKKTSASTSPAEPIACVSSGCMRRSAAVLAAMASGAALDTSKVRAADMGDVCATSRLRRLGLPWLEEAPALPPRRVVQGVRRAEERVLRPLRVDGRSSVQRASRVRQRHGGRQHAECVVEQAAHERVVPVGRARLLQKEHAPPRGEPG